METSMHQTQDNAIQTQQLTSTNITHSYWLGLMSWAPIYSAHVHLITIERVYICTTASYVSFKTILCCISYHPFIVLQYKKRVSRLHVCKQKRNVISSILSTNFVCFYS